MGNHFNNILTYLYLYTLSNYLSHPFSNCLNNISLNQGYLNRLNPTLLRRLYIAQKDCPLARRQPMALFQVRFQ